MNLPKSNREFEALLYYLKHERGCDLTGYKRSTLMRRFEHRMRSINIDSYDSYLHYLQSHSEEYQTLLEDVRINVTCFFRDSDAWSYLASDIIPRIIGNKQSDEPIRVWSAGCASGEEIYSLLILLAENLGIDSCLQRVQCYATDADEGAIKQARQGTYSDREIAEISPDWVEKYFDLTEQGYVFHPKLRRLIIFAKHDLEKNAPISKIDLLLCRNVLIYFHQEAQISILIRFHFALKQTGFLFLGKSETLVNRKQIFTPVHPLYKIYAKGSKLELEDHIVINPKFYKQQSSDSLSIQNHFWQAAFESSPVAQFAIDYNGRLVAANERANLLFELTVDDLNFPFQEIEPGKLIISHCFTQTFYRSRCPVTLKDVEHHTSRSTKYFDVAIVPVFNSQNSLLGSVLTFVEKVIVN